MTTNNGYSFRQLQLKVREEYQKNGYLDIWNFEGYNLQDLDATATKSIQARFDIAELGLIVSEVSEAMEEVRNKEPSTALLAFELADIIIRTMNFASRKGIDLESFIIEKHQKNMKREYLHDRRV